MELFKFDQSFVESSVCKINFMILRYTAVNIILGVFLY